MQRNIAIFIGTLKSAGAEKQASLLAKTLNKYHNIYLVVFRGSVIDNKFIELCNSENIKLIRLYGILCVRLWKFIKFIRRHKVEILFTYLAGDNFIGAMFGRLAGIKYVAGGIRNSVLPKSKLVTNFIIHHLWQTCTIFNNYSGAEKFIENYKFNKRKIKIIPNGFEFNVKPIKKREETTVNLLTINRFVKHKSIDTILFALQKLIKDYDIPTEKIKLFIIGHGTMEEYLRELTMKLKLNDSVSIIVNPENINLYFNMSDIYISASWYEGLSNAIMEALSFSIPVIATDVGDNSRLVKNEHNGFLFSVRDYNTLAKKIKILIDDNNLRTKFGNNSSKLLRLNYSLDLFRSNYLNLIESFYE